jgi:hypothetical protein
MKIVYFLSLLVILGIAAQSAGCSRMMQIKGSVSGNVFRDGRPMMGQIQLLDPKNQKSIKTEPVNNQGHFIVSDVPPGEWLLAFIGPSGAPMGNFKYVKVLTGRPVTGVVFEIFEVDPKVEELNQKLKAAQETQTPGGGTQTPPPGK